MKRLILSPCSAADEWQGEGLLLESSILASPADRDRIRQAVAEDKVVVIRDLAAPTMTRLIPQESEKIRLGFQTFLAERCEAVAALGISEFSLSFDLERAAEDAEFCKELKQILQSISGILMQFGLRLLLTAHLPSEGAADGRWLAQFRQDLLLPEVGFLLELHEDDDSLLEPLKFYADRIVKSDNLIM